MTDFISKIFGSLICIFENLLLSLIAIFFWFINALIVALCALLGLVIQLMPAMPSVPTLPGIMSTGLNWIAWVFPLDTVGEILDFTLAAYIIWLVVSIILNWAKAGKL